MGRVVGNQASIHPSQDSSLAPRLRLVSGVRSVRCDTYHRPRVLSPESGRCGRDRPTTDSLRTVYPFGSPLSCEDCPPRTSPREGRRPRRTVGTPPPTRHTTRDGRTRTRGPGGPGEREEKTGYG